MTTPSPEAMEKAREITSKWNDTIEYFYGMSEDNHESLLPNLIEQFALALDAAREKAVEEENKACEQIAYEARDDEEYGHAAFRCVQIAQNIRARREKEGK